MLSLYLCTFSLRLVAYFHSLDVDRYGPNTMPRTCWPPDDPTLVSEGVFAIANVFSFARIIYLFQANPQLGPLQISLGCMLIDIGKFFFIFFLVITSFACGLNQLYYFYSNAPATTTAVAASATTPSPTTSAADAFTTAEAAATTATVTTSWTAVDGNWSETIDECNVTMISQSAASVGDTSFAFDTLVHVYLIAFDLTDFRRPTNGQTLSVR